MMQSSECGGEPCFGSCSLTNRRCVDDSHCLAGEYCVGIDTSQLPDIVACTPSGGTQ